MSDTEDQQDIIDDLIEQCLNADEGLECLVDAFNEIDFLEAKDLCKPRLVMLTDPECTNCEDMKFIHNELMSRGTIQEVIVDSDAGQDIGEKTGIFGTPSLLLVDCNNDLIGEIYSDAEVEAI